MLTAIFGLFLTIARVQKVGLMRMRDKLSAENGGVQTFGEPSTVTCHIMVGIKKTHGIVVIYINACKHIKKTSLPQQNPPRQEFHQLLFGSILHLKQLGSTVPPCFQSDA